MKTKRRTPQMLAMLAITFGLISSVTHAEPSPEKPTPIAVKFDEAARSPLPIGIFGTQDEIVELSYYSDEYWKKAQDIGISLLRYPAGTPSDWFAWDDPEKGYWVPYFKERKKTYPDAFVALCRKYGLTPFVTVNTSTYGAPSEAKRINPMRKESIQKGADYAAAWVHDFNVTKKFGVRYWEIGNEMWIWLKAAEYPQYVNLYSAAMRKVDPSIKIVAAGLEHLRRPFYPSWMKFPNDPNWVPREVIQNDPFEWNQRLLTDAKGAFDYLALHIYFDGDSIDPVANTLQNFSSVAICQALNRAIYQIRNSGQPVRLAVTEWGVNFRWDPVFKNHFVGETMNFPEVANVTYENSPAFCFGSVLVSADFLGKLASSGMVDIAVSHTLGNGLLRSWNRKTKTPLPSPVETPMGAAAHFWREFSGNTVVPITLSDVPKSVFRSLTFPSVAAYATENSNGSRFLILVNRTPNKTFPMVLPEVVDGRPVNKIIEHALTAKSWGEGMGASLENEKVPSPFQRTDRNIPGDEWKNYLLKPNQLVCLEIQG